MEDSGDYEGTFPSRSVCVVSVDPLGGPSLLLGRLDSSHFWHGIDASPADRWSVGSWPCLFPLLGDQLRLVEPVLLHLLRKARLGVHCGASHSEVQLQLHRPRRMEFGQSTD